MHQEDVTINELTRKQKHDITHIVTYTYGELHRDSSGQAAGAGAASNGYASAQYIK